MGGRDVGPIGAALSVPQAHPVRLYTIRLTVGIVASMTLWGGGVARVNASVSATSTFQQANEHYRNGKFSEAASGYRDLLAAGWQNGVLYYNLGNALLKSGKKSEALWAYLKAKAFLPRDADVQANLEYVQALLQAGVNASVIPSRLIRWLTLQQRFATSELAGWSGLSGWLLVLMWSLATWKPQTRRVAQPVVWLSGTTALVFFTALVVKTLVLDGVPKAVVVREQIDVKFSPQTTGTTHFELPEGTIVQVLGHEFGWVQLKRADGLSGWVPEDTLNAL